MSTYQPIKFQSNSSSIQTHIKQLETQMINSQTEHSRIESVYRTYEYQLEKLHLINKLVNQSPRFDWLQIQSEIFRLYKLDSTITGCIIQFNFKNTIPANRAHIVFNTYLKQQKHQQKHQQKQK